MINKIDTLCNELNKYLIDRYNYKRHPASYREDTINAKTKQFDIYLRYQSKCVIFDKYTLVIARIGFEKTHSGNGTSLINFFLTNANTFGYTKIGIECANKNSSEFAKKLKFMNIQKNYWLLEI